MRPIILTAMILAGFAGSRAEAQGTNCQGRVSIDAVYMSGVGGDRYEYFFVLRNRTNLRLALDVSFQNFPSNVTLFSPSLPNIPLGPNATMSPNMRFGNGTNANISMQTVRIAYDGAGSSGPTVRVRNCRAG